MMRRKSFLIVYFNLLYVNQLASLWVLLKLNLVCRLVFLIIILLFALLLPLPTFLIGILCGNNRRFTRRYTPLVKFSVSETRGFNPLVSFSLKIKIWLYDKSCIKF